MAIEHPQERRFYEIEADKVRWDVERLQHQVYTFISN
jgi:predicted nuclease of restriction endonuclease-like (RecB) superfamily